MNPVVLIPYVPQLLDHVPPPVEGTHDVIEVLAILLKEVNRDGAVPDPTKDVVEDVVDGVLPRKLVNGAKVASAIIAGITLSFILSQPRSSPSPSRWPPCPPTLRLSLAPPPPTPLIPPA